MVQSDLSVASHDDLDLVAQMMRELREDDPIPNSDWATTERALRDLLTRPDWGKVYLARRDGNVVGYAIVCYSYSLEFGGRDAFIDELLVTRASRGRGVGAEILDALAALLKAEGIHAVNLEVHAHNPACNLYRRRGFVDRGYRLMTRYL